MPYLDHLPAPVARLIQTRYIAEFATVSRAGDPIDSVLVPFASEDLETIDSATGLAYPIKAERLRRNPKAGMLFEGGADQPVALISGFGAVRDTDFQGNLERYLSEQILTSMLDPAVTGYETVTRQAIWYFTRIVMCVKPAVVRWWDSAAALDGPPHAWRAAEGTVWPQSDPAPPGSPGKAAWSNPPPWRETAEAALARKAAAHLTLIDAEGFPLPLRAREIHADSEGFRLVMPAWLPWSSGRASVSFEGIETFIGEAEIAGNEVLFRSERALPLHPLMTSPGEILRPRPKTQAALMARIEHELARRSLTLPRMPDHPPKPTAGARTRADAAFAFPGFADG